MIVWRLFSGLLLSAISSAIGPIEYSSVSVAMQSLLIRNDVAIEVQSGWSIITEKSGVIWTFVPLEHPGYPSVMRQNVQYKADGSVTVDMAVLCQTKKTPCAQMIEEFRARNRLTAEQLKHVALQRAVSAESAPLQLP